MHRWPEAPVMSDSEHHACVATSSKPPGRIGAGERKRLLAENLLARARAGDHLRRMQRMGRCQQHGVDGAVSEDGIQIAAQLKMMLRAKTLRSFDVRLYGADDF